MVERSIYLILILTSSCYYYSNPCYSETDTLHQGQLLKDWDELISSNNVFSLKFFGFHTTISPYPTLVLRNASVTLLDTGNLVLRELYADGAVKQVLWQSFDYPTDTLLPGMKLGVNLKTGHKSSLTSWASNQLPAHGSFTLTIDPNGTGQLVILRRGNIRWKSGPWQNGQFKNSHLLSSSPNVSRYYISNETEQSFTYLTKTYDLLPSLKIYQDGFLRGSTLILNVLCSSTNEPGCAEENYDTSKCRKDCYFTLTDDYIYADEYVIDESYNLTLNDCQGICWGNCSCVAYAYTTENKAGCKTYSQIIYNPAEAPHHPCTDYYVIKHLGDDYIYADEYVIDESYNLTLNDCQGICWGNCSCVAYDYTTENKAGCKTYSQIIYNPAEAPHHPCTDYYVIKHLGEKKMEKKAATKTIWIGWISVTASVVLLLSCYLAYKKLDVGGSCTPKEVMTCIHVGLLCVQDQAMDRPTMSEVISMLTNENMHLPEPKQPAFFIERCEAGAPRDINLEKRSANGQSISIVVAR
ncbi:hypothetical protein CTI12_AA348100 [Artemisia annua]|uniref:Apple domain-containing protein n=1 Tax=Artemisia annua TaxID=35608 RepID=A0A2U1MSA6_ARTAN|nr:hypothetical protein CTI12_AA348100 [Artemisia annua]